MIVSPPHLNPKLSETGSLASFYVQLKKNPTLDINPEFGKKLHVYEVLKKMVFIQELHSNSTIDTNHV